MESNVAEMDTNQIKITNAQLNNHVFMQGLGRLRNMPLGIKTSYKISYIANHVDRHVKQGREVFMTMAKKFAKLDDDGNLIPETHPENGQPLPGTFLFKDDESEKEFQKEHDEFIAMEHVIPKHKLSVEELGDTKFSANDISALGPLFSDLD